MEMVLKTVIATQDNRLVKIGRKHLQEASNPFDSKVTNIGRFLVPTTFTAPGGTLTLVESQNLARQKRHY